MRASRLVNVLLLLQTRSRMTAAELAEELEVSVRTIYRDVEALSEAGVPIYAERGPHGGVRLVDGYRTRLTGLTADEAEAVFLSGLPGPAAELGLGTVVAAARLKVMAALPPELRARASRVSERFHLDAPGWFQASESLPHLEVLAAAVWDNRTILMRYRRGERGGVVDRQVDPIGLVLKGGVWYLVGRTDGEFRTYRVSRVEQVDLITDHFERPDGFDLAEYWDRSTEAYERSIERFPITIRLAPERLDAFAGVVSTRVMAAATRTPDPDYPDLVRLRVAFDWMDEAVGAVLRMGSGVEVLEPDWLRHSILEAAQAIVDRYKDDLLAKPDSVPAALPG
jgi:predicted DNA-binding transcriptional regulator YafY